MGIVSERAPVRGSAVSAADKFMNGLGGSGSAGGGGSREPAGRRGWDSDGGSGLYTSEDRKARPSEPCPCGRCDAAGGLLGLPPCTPGGRIHFVRCCHPLFAS